jgi:hypothetical protein
MAHMWSPTSPSPNLVPLKPKLQNELPSSARDYPLIHNSEVPNYMKSDRITKGNTYHGSHREPFKITHIESDGITNGRPDQRHILEMCHEQPLLSCDVTTFIIRSSKDWRQSRDWYYMSSATSTSTLSLLLISRALRPPHRIKTKLKDNKTRENMRRQDMNRQDKTR